MCEAPLWRCYKALEGGPDAFAAAIFGDSSTLTKPQLAEALKEAGAGDVDACLALFKDAVDRAEFDAALAAERQSMALLDAVTCASAVVAEVTADATREAASRRASELSMAAFWAMGQLQMTLHLATMRPDPPRSRPVAELEPEAQPIDRRAVMSIRAKAAKVIAAPKKKKITIPRKKSEKKFVEEEELLTGRQMRRKHVETENKMTFALAPEAETPLSHEEAAALAVYESKRARRDSEAELKRLLLVTLGGEVPEKEEEEQEEGAKTAARILNSRETPPKTTVRWSVRPSGETPTTTATERRRPSSAPFFVDDFAKKQPKSVQPKSVLFTADERALPQSLERCDLAEGVRVRLNDGDQIIEGLPFNKSTTTPRPFAETAFAETPPASVERPVHAPLPPSVLPPSTRTPRSIAENSARPRTSPLARRHHHSSTWGSNGRKAEKHSSESKILAYTTDAALLPTPLPTDSKRRPRTALATTPEKHSAHHLFI